MNPIAEIVGRVPERRINVLDVGCYAGTVTLDFAMGLRNVSKEIFSIGIDPIAHCHVYRFTHFIEAAIRNCEPTTATFYQYSDPQCSSLLKMTTNLTHNREERDKKWYSDRDFERLLATKSVRVLPLSAIIEQFNLQEEYIHFLKIDVQGCDLEAFLSLGPYIKSCLFVQIETVVSGSKDIILYEGQTLHEEELPIMAEHGFEVFSLIDYRDTYGTPEADVVYVNTELRKQKGLA